MDSAAGRSAACARDTEEPQRPILAWALLRSCAAPGIRPSGARADAAEAQNGTALNEGPKEVCIYDMTVLTVEACNERQAWEMSALH